MKTVEIIIWSLIFLLTPALILIACNKIKLLGKIGAIIISYALGLILGNLGLIPNNIEPLQKAFVTATIPLAIPLILFSMDFKKFLLIADKTFLSMLLAIISLLVVLFVGVIIFRNTKEISEIAGMLVGVYTGGTPNLASIKTSLKVDENIYLMTHTSDMFIGIFLLLYFMTVAKKTLLIILPDFDSAKLMNNNNISNEKNVKETLSQFDDSPKAYANLLKKENLPDLLKAFAITIFIVLISLGIGFLFRDIILPQKHKDLFDAIVIISITSLAIASSFVKKIRNLKNTFQLGMYIILIFSFVVASLGKFEKIINSETSHIFYFVAWTVILTFILHVILSSFFKIDTDTTLITATALIMSPPFVPVVADSLKNKYIIMSGMIIGIIGYAIGNYLGVAYAYLLQNLLNVP